VNELEEEATEKQLAIAIMFVMIGWSGTWEKCATKRQRHFTSLCLAPPWMVLTSFLPSFTPSFLSFSLSERNAELFSCIKKGRTLVFNMQKDTSVMTVTRSIKY